MNIEFHRNFPKLNMEFLNTLLISGKQTLSRFTIRSSWIYFCWKYFLGISMKLETKTQTVQWPFKCILLFNVPRLNPAYVSNTECYNQMHANDQRETFWKCFSEQGLLQPLFQ